MASVRVVSTVGSDWYGFVTSSAAGGGGHTQPLVSSDGGSARVPAGHAHGKVTLFRYNAERVTGWSTRFFAVVTGKPVSAVESGGGLHFDGKLAGISVVSTTTSTTLVDVTGKVRELLMSDYKRLGAAYKMALADSRVVLTDVDRRFVHAYMVECELPPDFRVPCCAVGWPQMGGLKHVARRDVLAEFGCALAAAKTMTHFVEVAGMAADDVALVQRCLFVCALRMYCGKHPVKDEDVDDRSLGCLKLYTNMDCDDMVLSACAMFYRLKEYAAKTSVWSIGDENLFSAEMVIRRCLPTMSAMYACQGLVDLRTGSGSLSGHVWGCIALKGGGYLHAECTDCVSPTPDDRVHAFFKRRVGTVGLGRASLSRYVHVCAVYSRDGMWVPRVGGARDVSPAYADVLAGKAGAFTPICPGVSLLPSTATYIDGMRHSPSEADLQFIVKGGCPHTCTPTGGGKYDTVLPFCHWRK
jgi:hypothetical protein